MEMDIYERGLKIDPRSTALHEMQHAVQTLEGMSPGGNLTMAFNDPRAFEILKRKREEVATPMTVDEFRKASYGREVPDPERLDKAYKEYLASYKVGPEIDRQLQQAAAQEYYQRLAGEAEARATQARQEMTPQQRQQEYPYATYDVPSEDLLTSPPREYAGGGALAKAVKAAQAVGRQAPAVVIPSAISRVQEAVRQSKGDFGARRVQRAADEIPNLERMYQEDGLRFAFTGDNAQALMTMKPGDFEKFAKKLEGRTSADIGPKMAELAKKGEIDKYTLPTDEYIQYLQKLRGGFEEPAFLSLNKEEAGLPLMPFISGHEGRHRSRALAASGQPTSLVRLIPRAELREPFPRRSQEEYLDALRQELDLTGNLVVPEGGGSPVVLPDIYAKGGPVHISSNPDTMRLELNERRMGAGGFLAKAVKGAQKALPAAEREANLQKFLEPSKTPMRLYHGTTATEGGKGAEAIRRLKPSKEGALGSGAYLTPKPTYADEYTSGSGGNVLPVYAQIKNPLVLNMDGNYVGETVGSIDPMILALTKLGVEPDKAARMVERAYENKGYIGKEVETRARAQGYDGLMQYRNGELTEVVSYNPNAIKSAIGNEGTYNTSVPDLSKAAGGAISADDLTIEERPL